MRSGSDETGAFIRTLAAQGWRVIVIGRDRSRGNAVVAEIAALAAEGDGVDIPRAVFVSSDLAAAPDVLRELAAAVTEVAGGRLDAIVHNAAVCSPVDTLSLTDADLEATLAVNVRAPHVLTASLAPAMAERRHGAIVVIGSWMAHIGHPIVGLDLRDQGRRDPARPQLGRRVRASRRAGQHGLPRCYPDADQRDRWGRHRRDDCSDARWAAWDAG